MPRPDPTRAILLTMAVFALHPLAFGGWLAFIPLVKDQLGLNKAELSLALLGLPAAVVPGLQIASRVIARIGPRRVMAVVFPLYAMCSLLPLLAVGQATLFAALFVFGIGMAFLQVSLNVYAGRLEKQAGTHVMNRCHGFWALGLMAGPLLATALLALSPLGAVACIAGVSGAVAAGLALRLPRLTDEGTGRSPPRRTPGQIPRALFAISVMMLFISMTEGAMSDWAAVYLAERMPEGSRSAGLGVSIFAGMLAVGRLSGDWLKARLGAVRLARITIALAIAGLGCLVLPLPLAFALLGFGLVGAGASVGFPLGVSAVAALDDQYEAANIAIMSSITLCGFLVGPPMIGFLAEAFSLRIGLAALLPGLFIAWGLAGRLRPPPGPDLRRPNGPARAKSPDSVESGGPA